MCTKLRDYEVKIKSETGFCPEDFLKKVFGEDFFEISALDICILENECREIRKSLGFSFSLWDDEYNEDFLEERLRLASTYFPDLKIYFIELNFRLLCVGDWCYQERFLQNGNFVDKKMIASPPQWDNLNDEEVFKGLRSIEGFFSE